MAVGHRDRIQGHHGGASMHQRPQSTLSVPCCSTWERATEVGRTMLSDCVCSNSGSINREMGPDSTLDLTQTSPRRRRSLSPVDLFGSQRSGQTVGFPSTTRFPGPAVPPIEP